MHTPKPQAVLQRATDACGVPVGKPDGRGVPLAGGKPRGSMAFGKHEASLLRVVLLYSGRLPRGWIARPWITVFPRIAVAGEAFCMGRRGRGARGRLREAID